MKRKIIILLLAIFILLTAGFVLSFINIRDITKGLNRIIKLHQVEQLRRTLLIKLQSVQTNLYTVNTAFSQNLDTIVENMESLENTSAICTSCHHPPYLNEKIISIQHLIKDYEYHVSYYITIRANEKRMQELKKESALIGDNLLAEIQNMSHVASKDLENITERTSETIDTVIRILVFTLILVIIISLFLAYRLIISITNPIHVLLSATRSISSGELGVIIKHDYDTEFGELADNFNIMSASLKKSYDDFSREMSDRIEAEKKLRESEERYALAARGANDGLWDWDLKTNTIYYSERWKSILGYSVSELSDEPEEWFKRIHPDDSFTVEKDIFNCKEWGSGQFQKEYRILHKDGIYRWVLTRGLMVSDESKNPVRMIGSQTDITERKSAEDRLLYDAFHDSLTDLPNRALFFDHLELAAKRVSRNGIQGLFAVLFIDIDRFKIVNDTIGHMAGDKLLIAISKKLREFLRPGDTVARFGGDEFAIILEDILDTEDVFKLLDRMKENISQPYFIGDEGTGDKIFSTVSIGVCFSSFSYKKPEDLLRNADIAMYHAKTAGRDCYKVFKEDMYRQVMTTMQLERDLKNALENHEFILNYQPVLSIDSGGIIGFEALIRWQHPIHGLLYPKEFISLAEETGLIYDLGEWVLREACRQIKIWQDKYPGRDPLTISVNISSKQFSEALIETVKNILDETKIAPNSLKIEITESILMENSTIIASLLKRLKNLNIELQIDDFGTGYSSLSYLHNYPIDAIKIDKEFINQLNNKKEEKIAIVNAITSLARTLNMYVIAEGVENEDQASKLKMLSCDHMQGFLISKPLSIHDAEVFLDKKVN